MVRGKIFLEFCDELRACGKRLELMEFRSAEPAKA